MRLALPQKRWAPAVRRRGQEVRFWEVLGLTGRVVAYAPMCPPSHNGATDPGELRCRNVPEMPSPVTREQRRIVYRRGLTGSKGHWVKQQRPAAALSRIRFAG